METNNNFEDKKEQSNALVNGISTSDVLERDSLKQLSIADAQQLVDTIKSFCSLVCSVGVSSSSKIIPLCPKEIVKKAA